jgi:hypothetical protein
MRFVLLSTVLLLAACGGHDAGDIDEIVGAPCSSDRDCDSRCYLDSGDYPGGFCSMSCQTDNDCPGDTYCMAKDGGVCLFACPAFDCSRLGTGWGCHEKDRQNGGKQNVCIGG